VVGGTFALKTLKKPTKAKAVVPLANSLLKLIRQSEVLLMTEAVTDQIMRKGGI
jgi:hypothetical protein